MKRLENETREEYKVRLKLYNEVMNPEFQRHKPYNLTRDQYFEMLDLAQQEIQAARAQGYSDREILESMNKGDNSQRLYGTFIESEVLKRG